MFPHFEFNFRIGGPQHQNDETCTKTCPKKVEKDPFRPKYRLFQNFQKHIFKFPHFEHIFRIGGPQHQNDETCPNNVLKKVEKDPFRPK